MKETLGEHVFNAFLKIKTREWAEFTAAVHHWELDRYLAKY